MSKEDEDILFYAFRYALGRKTGVVSQMVGIIITRWKDISAYKREMMKHEIQHAIAMGTAGMDCDIEEWKKILQLVADEKAHA